MLYRILTTSGFDRDVKRLQRQHADMELLWDIVDKLSKGEALPEKNRDHKLSGNLKAFRECHITNRWVLRYAKDSKKLVLVLTSTGTHRDALNVE